MAKDHEERPDNEQDSRTNGVKKRSNKCTLSIMTVRREYNGMMICPHSEEVEEQLEGPDP